jgi:hypothetical protein
MRRIAMIGTFLSHYDDLLADLRRERKALEYMKTGDVKTAAPAEKHATPDTPERAMILISLSIRSSLPTSPIR